MNLKTFDTTVFPQPLRKYTPSIRMARNGIITINRSAMECIGIGPGDRILFHQDEDKPTDWYIEKTTGDNGFLLRRGGNKQVSLRFGSIKLKEQIIGSINKDMSSFGMPIGSEAIEGKYWPLITSGIYG